MITQEPTLLALRKLVKALPPGASFAFTLDSEVLWLNRILLPRHARNGGGSRLLARILMIADRTGLPVMLEASPTERPGDPGVFDLVRWYSRFSFQCIAINEDGVVMRREPGSHRSWESLLADAKSRTPITLADFTAWQPDKPLPSPAMEYPTRPLAPSKRDPH